MSTANWIYISYFAGLATGLGLWAYALFQQPKERADGGPFPVVDLPGKMK